MKRPTRRLFIVFGYNASPQQHWFPWLKSQLESDGVEVSVLAMPDSGEPGAEAWLSCLASAATDPDENSYFVGHSLGCITILRYLDSLTQPTPVGGFVLVSGFAQALPGLPKVDEFTRAPLDFAHISARARRRVVVASRDDLAVPHEWTAELGRRLDARLLSVELGGHFLGGEGFTEFPLVRDELIRMMRD